MISPFFINPKPENNKAKAFVGTLGSLGGAIFIVSMYIERYRGVVALVAMMLIVAALTISVKYILSEFTYEITNADGDWLFIVGQRSGKRCTTLCRVGLAFVTSIEKKKRGEDKEKGADYQRFSFIPTLMPESYYVMTVEHRGDKSKIALQLTDPMADLLRTYVAEARLLAPDIDEE